MTVDNQMTIAKFLEELAAVEGKLVFGNLGDVIRITCCDKKCLNLCPITAVYYKRTGYAHNPNDWWYAAERLGLSYMTGSSIVASADGLVDFKIGKGESLRDKMIEILKQIKTKSK